VAATWRVVSEIHEAQDYPVVVHTFYGQSAAEAISYYTAHSKADSFLRGCTQGGSFGSNLMCTEKHWIERFFAGQWTRV
jgi:hypothetical protein